MKRRVLIAVLVLLALIGAAMGFLGGTTTGLRWTLQWAAQASGGALQMADVQGRLLGTVTIGGLRYRTTAVQVRIGRVQWQWRPAALLYGRLHVTDLELDGLQVRSRATATPSKPGPVTLPHVVLPVSVALDRARARGVEVIRTDGETVAALDAITLQAGVRGDRVRLGSVRVRRGDTRLDVSGSITLRGSYPLALKADWQTRLQAVGTLAGSIRLGGSLGHLTVAQQTRGALRSSLQGTLTDLLDEPRWQAELQVQALDPARFNPAWPQGRLTAKLHGDGRIEAFQLSGSVDAETSATGQLEGSFKARVQGQRLQLQQFEVRRAGTRAALSGSGEARWNTVPVRLDISGQWEGLGWPLRANGRQITSPQGRFSISGTAENYRFQLNAALRAPQIPPAQLTAQGSGGTGSATISALRVATLGGHIEGSGRLAWRPELAWSTQLTAKDLDPGKQWSDWPGRLQAALRIKGSSGPKGTAGTLELDKLDGRLRQYPVSARGKVAWHGARLQSIDVDARSGTANAQLSGAVTDTWNLNWRIDAPDLKAVLPRGAGSVRAKGTVAGALAAPRAKGSVEGRQLHVGDYGAEVVQGRFDFGTSDKAPFDIHVDARNLELPRQRWSRAKLEGRGTGARHHLQLALDAGRQHVAVAVDGGIVRGDQWRGRLTRADVDLASVGAWHLTAAGPLELAHSRVRLGPWCWTQKAAKLCLGGRKDQAAWSGRLDANGVPLALLQPLLAPETRLTGAVTGHLQATYGPGKGLEADAELATSAGALEYPLAGNAESLRLGAGSLQAKVNGAGATVRLQLPVGADGDLKGQLRLPGWRPAKALETQAVTGELRAKLPNLAMLAPLFPQANKLAGVFDARLGVSGSLARPRLRGTATLQGGHAEIPALGIRLQAVSAQISGDAGQLTYSGSAQSGGGAVRFSGGTRLEPGQGWPTHLKLEGKNFQVADIPEASVYVSPKLEAEVRGRRVDLSGEITVPRGDIKPKELPKGTVAVSQDVVIVGKNGEQQAARESRWAIHTRIRLIVGDKVKFDGFGLRGRLVGNVLLVDEPKKLTVGRGDLGIENGTYRAYGQNLAIERGRLIFADSVVTNPGLDVRATRTVGSVVAGVRVTGTLKQPRLKLFSTPAMTDSQTLSYLVTGRPLNETSASQGKQLRDAATALGLFGGESIAKSLGSALGLQEVGVERTAGATGTETSQLVLGRYLSPRLYLRYAIGLFEKSEVLQLRYDLTRRLQLQTETGTRMGVDLFYTIH
jgi:translocation and assembly module TamB